MTKKQEFGIICNGEHLERGFASRETAESRIAELRQKDQEFIGKGWLTAEQVRKIRYWIEQIRYKNW